MYFHSPRRRAILGSALLLTCLQAAAVDFSPSLRHTVDRAVAPLLTEAGVPGLAVAVTVDGRTSFYNYGVASKESSAPVTEHTLFEVGSVSKPFTATLALYAQALGKLSLDQHPGAYLPQLKGRPIDAATLLHLGTYTAGGLPLQVPDEITDQAGLMAYLRDFTPQAAPGTQRTYSNPSIGLFGHIAALALGTPFDQAMESLFPALGMRESFVRVPASAERRYAWGYADGKPRRVSPDVFDAQAYGVKASTADLIRFVQLNLQPVRASDALRRAIEGTQLGYFQVGEMVQGLGWEQYRGPVTLARLLAGNSSAISAAPNPASAIAEKTAPPGTWFNKTGSTRAFSAYVVFVPSQRIGVVLLANTQVSSAARITAAHAIMTSLSSMVHD